MKRLLVLAAIAVLAPSSQAARGGGTPVALVTSETLNQLLAVGLPSGKVVKRFHVPADPENVEICGSVAAVVSTRGGAVTLVDAAKLKVRRILRGFGTPHIAACSPDGHYVYVTDDARGQLAVIHNRVVRKIFVGQGAHHMAASPDQPRLWIALGERARSIVVLDTTEAANPRLIARIAPHGLAHDLAFSPDGRNVWVTYDDRSEIGVFSAQGRFRHFLPAGSPPQHVAFDPFSHAKHAYVTSGNDGTMRIVSVRTGRTLRVVRTGYGSFNLGLSGSLIVTSSLYRGTLTELYDSGHVVFSKHIAPAARDAAIAVL